MSRVDTVSLISIKQGVATSSPASWPAASHRVQARCEISQQVCLTFQSNRKPQQSVADPGGEPGFLGHARVRHGGGVGNQAFNAAKRFRQGEYLDRLDKAAHAIDAFRDFETQHGPEAGLLGLGDRVSRMGCQPGIMHNRHGRVLVKESGNPSSSLLLLFDAREQGADSA